MKVGDMVRYVREEKLREWMQLDPEGPLWEEEPDTDVALVVGRPPENRGEFVDVLWNDGEICSHAVDELEVANEDR
jgi:hypothetical protein